MLFASILNIILLSLLSPLPSIPNDDADVVAAAVATLVTVLSRPNPFIDFHNFIILFCYDMAPFLLLFFSVRFGYLFNFLSVLIVINFLVDKFCPMENLIRMTEGNYAFRDDLLLEVFHTYSV